MDDLTRRQLLTLSADFYRAQAAAFDASRGHAAWPGWERMLASLPRDRSPLRVLDVGCGNARLARFLADACGSVGYVGVDANAELLKAARRRLPEPLRAGCRLVQHDFLQPPPPGRGLPDGPFDAVVLMGVLHHVPGLDWRRALLSAAAARLAPGGCLALAVWQFAGRPRFATRRVDWSAIGPVGGTAVDPGRLEPGDHLLRFGADPDAPPRYCHQLEDAEIDGWPGTLGLDRVDDYRADGASSDLNRYVLMRRPA